MPTQRTAARILVDQLIAQGVDRATCVPGESYLSVLDALLGSGIDLLTCRAEGGAAMLQALRTEPAGRTLIVGLQGGETRPLTLKDYY